MPFSFAIVADTHIRPEPLDRQSSWPSDRLQNDRNRRVLALLRQRAPDFVIHLGDLTHSLPGLPGHERALAFARAFLAPLPCRLVVAPGNHDVGDKADSLATAPRVDEHSHEAFDALFGPCWRAFDHGGCRFILLDASLLGSGLSREAAMRRFLLQSLENARRTFVFLHYPPFLHQPDEPSHYDNLPLEARAWLLDLLRRHKVEVVFSGHAHTFFYNRLSGTDFYSVPSTAFTRPEYAELHPVEPATENGRDDADKLGFFLVHVEDSGHRVEFVRSGWQHEAYGAPPCPLPLGVWLRGNWARVLDLPHGDLDEFTRKLVRNDWPLLALWELGLERVRVLVGDLLEPSTSARLRETGRRFPRLVVLSVGRPDEATRRLLQKWSPRVDAWEILVSEQELEGPWDALDAVGVPVSLSLLPREEPDEKGYFSHFPRPGFTVDAPALSRVPSLPPCACYLSFRIPFTEPVFEGVNAAVDAARNLGLGAICHIEMPRGTESMAGRDDVAVSKRAATAFISAMLRPEVPIFLDTFEDKDRGYYPRHGLIDRRANPRAAARVLRRLGLLAAGSFPSASGIDRFQIEMGELFVHPDGDGPWLDLDTGVVSERAPEGPALRLARPAAVAPSGRPGHGPFRKNHGVNS